MTPLVSHPLVTQYTCQYEEKEEDFNVLRLTGRTGNGINDAEGDGLLIGFILDCYCFFGFCSVCALQKH